MKAAILWILLDTVFGLLFQALAWFHGGIVSIVVWGWFQEHRWALEQWEHLYFPVMALGCQALAFNSFRDVLGRYQDLRRPNA